MIDTRHILTVQILTFLRHQTTLAVNPLVSYYRPHPPSPFIITICLPTLVLLAQVVFLYSADKQTDRHD